MTNTRIAHINKAKKHLGKAAQRFKAASDMLDEVLKEVIPGWPTKPDDWDAVAPEHHLLADCRSTITAMKRQARQMLQQLLHVKRIETVRLRSKKKTKAETYAEELFDMLDRVVYAAETRDEKKYEEEPIYRPTINEAYALIDKIREK